MVINDVGPQIGGIYLLLLQEVAGLYINQICIKDRPLFLLALQHGINPILFALLKLLHLIQTQRTLYQISSWLNMHFLSFDFAKLTV